MLSGSLPSESECMDVVSQLQFPIPVSLSQHGRSSMIVFDNADIDSAVDCIADKAFFASGKSQMAIYIKDLKDLLECALDLTVYH